MHLYCNPSKLPFADLLRQPKKLVIYALLIGISMQHVVSAGGWCTSPPLHTLSASEYAPLFLTLSLCSWGLTKQLQQQKCFWFVFDLFELGTWVADSMSRLATKTAKNSHKQITMPPPLAISIAIAVVVAL